MAVKGITKKKVEKDVSLTKESAKEVEDDDKTLDKLLKQEAKDKREMRA